MYGRNTMKIKFIYFSHFLYTVMIVKHQASKSRQVWAIDEASEMDRLEPKNQTVLDSVC